MRSEKYTIKLDPLHYLPTLKERWKVSQYSRQGNRYDHDSPQKCQHEAKKAEDSRSKANFHESTNFVHSYADPSA